MASRLVLMVDDDPNLRDLVGLILSEMGLRVATAATGAEGLDLARSLHPDLILLDDRTPGPEGPEVLRRLKGSPQTVDIPIVVMTAVPSPELFQSPGPDEVLRKPFDPDQLEALVRRCLGLPGPGVDQVDPNG